jgi:hypothetical protein
LRNYIIPSPRLAAMSHEEVSYTQQVEGPHDENYPGFERHMADQSAMSILFKAYGFRHMKLSDVHNYMMLKRWRE